MLNAELLHFPELDGGHGVEWIKIANDVKLIVGTWLAMQLRLHRHVQLHTMKALLRMAQIFCPCGSRMMLKKLVDGI